VRKIWKLLTGHWQIFVLYFGVITVLRILGGNISFDLINWWIGGLIGMWFVIVDRVAYVYFTRPHEQLSIQVKGLVNQRRYVEALRLINHRKDEQKNLAIRSVLFVGVWILLALFVLTSSGSLFAVGLVMGVGLHLLYDMVVDLNDIGKLRSWLFWPVKRMVSDDEARVVVAIYGFMFVILSFLMV